jgi:hypothetical protein
MKGKELFSESVPLINQVYNLQTKLKFRCIFNFVGLQFCVPSTLSVYKFVYLQLCRSSSSSLQLCRIQLCHPPVKDDWNKHIR